MGALVQYRDLPGGPTELRLCDELNRRCLCTNCAMLSMSMLQDKNHHVFCETCLMETTEKNHSDHIYCKYENKQVGIFEMTEAKGLITVIRCQYVLCPNPECNTPVILDQLKEHYMACQPTVTCSTCHRQVQTAEWSYHSRDCHERGAYKTPPKATMPQQVQHNDALLSPNPSQSVKMDDYRNNGHIFRPMYPSSELQQAQKPTNNGPDKVTLCQYCEKKVKEMNLPQHLTACRKAPRPCVYCEEEFSKENIRSHLAVCKANPCNIREQAQERSREANHMYCQPTVTCSTCDRQVKSAEWSSHSKDCRERGTCKTPSKGAIPKQVRPKYGLRLPKPLPPVGMDSNRNNGDKFSPIYPSRELQEAQKPTNNGPDKITLCQYCEKKIKERNLPQHLMACPKGPRPCVYCEKEFSKENIQSHLAVCKANPDNIREQAQERNREPHRAVCEKNPDNDREQVPEKRKEFVRPIWRFEYI